MSKIQLKVTKDGFIGNLLGTASYANIAPNYLPITGGILNGGLTINGTLAQGLGQGQEVTASGIGSHAQGAGTIASGLGSHAEGKETRANGQYSHAEGHKTVVDGQYAHAEGLKTSATSNYQTVVGKLNKVDSGNEYAFIVGNGTETDPSQSSADVRSNAFAVRWDGNLEINPGKALLGTASYALVAESVKDSGSLIVDTADKARTLLTQNGSSSYAANTIFESFSIGTDHTASITIGGKTLRQSLGLSESASYASTASYLTPDKSYNVGNLDASGNITILGNLTVKGTQTVVETTELKVKDKLIEVASGSNTRPLIDGAGIQLGDAALGVSITYNNTADAISTQKYVSASGYKKAGSSDNYVLLGGGGHKAISELSPATASYANSASRAVSAERADLASVATKLTSTSGSATVPVYISNGVPTPINYSIASSVPVNAKFTDTTYTGSISLKSNGTEVTKFELTAGQNKTANFELVTGSNVQLQVSDSKIKISATDTVYVHPAYNSVTPNLYKIGRDATGHVLIGDAITNVPSASYSSTSKYAYTASILTGSNSRMYFNGDEELVIEFDV